MSNVKSLLLQYDQVPTGQKVLLGHIMKILYDKRMSHRQVEEWANEENSKNGFSSICIGMGAVLSASKILRARQSSRINNEKFIIGCDREAWGTSKIASGTTQSTALTSTELKKKVKDQAKMMKQQKRVEEMEKKLLKSQLTLKKLKCKQLELRRKLEKKQTQDKLLERKKYYICLLNNVAQKRIPLLLADLAKIGEVKSEEILSESAIHTMPGELGFLTDYQTAEAVLNSETATLIFDATTQDGIHVNCVLLSTAVSTYVLSIRHLAGGTAMDYEEDICNAIDDLARNYSLANHLNFDECKINIISKINSSLTDRAAVNHAAISRLEKAWNKEIVQVNCNLHPLEAIARKCRDTLVTFEDTEARNLFDGSECLAWRVMKRMNSLRYKDKNGSVKECKRFLVDENLKKTLLPRLRGNRLNIVFHLGYIYFIHFPKFTKFLEVMRNTSDLITDLMKGFQHKLLILQFQVLGVLDKLISGPWMATFYVSLRDTRSVEEGIDLVQGVVDRLKEDLKHPSKILQRREDYFGKPIDFDEGLERLMTPPQNDLNLFTSMMEACLQAIIDVLQRQYHRQFNEMEKLKQSNLTSCRQHTMEAESCVGMFSEKIQKYPTYDVSTISNLVKATKNKMIDFLINCPDDIFSNLVRLAMSHSRTEGEKNKQNKIRIQREIDERITKNTKDGNKKRLTCELKKILSENPDFTPDTLSDEFGIDFGQELSNILKGEILFRNLTHIWCVDGKNVKFRALVKSYMDDKYTIYYYREDLDEHEEDFEMNKYDLGVDYLQKDLFFD